VLGLIMVARRTEEKFGAVFAAGTAAWLLVQAGIHVGSALGLIPYLGAKLPLVSFGGSGIVFTLGCVGLVVGSGLRSAARSHRR
jgi:cell division protein FtsW